MDFARQLEYTGINEDGKYVILAVQDTPYDRKQRYDYFVKCKPDTPLELTLNLKWGPYVKYNCKTFILLIFPLKT